MMEGQTNLHPLSMVTDRCQIHIQGLPSWAIDFSAHIGDSVEELNAKLECRLIFNALKGSPTLLGRLFMRGRSMDQIASILDVIADVGEAPSEVIKSSLEPYPGFALRWPEIYMNGQNRVGMLWRTLVWDLNSVNRETRHPASIKYGASIRSWLTIKVYMGVRSAVRAGAKRSDCF